MAELQLKLPMLKGMRGNLVCIGCAKKLHAADLLIRCTKQPPIKSMIAGFLICRKIFLFRKEKGMLILKYILDKVVYVAGCGVKCTYANGGVQQWKLFCI